MRDSDHPDDFHDDDEGDTLVEAPIVDRDTLSGELPNTHPHAEMPPEDEIDDSEDEEPTGTDTWQVPAVDHED